MQNNNSNQKVIHKAFMLLNNQLQINNIVDNTVQILGHTIYPLNPLQPIINFNNIKKTNLKYVQLQLDWYNSQNLNCQLVANVAKIWNNCCDYNRNVNSNYGYLIYSAENYYQYKNCVLQLQKNKNSRRAMMIYNRPSMHYDAIAQGMNDFVCTMYNSFYIRNNKLYSIYNMRSNDIIYGFFNDFYWCCHVYMKVYNDLLLKYNDLQIGQIYWQAASLHAYEKHFKLVKKIAEINFGD